jgi:hypothetical protein
MKKPIQIMMLTAGLAIVFGAPSIAWSSVFQISEVYSALTGAPTAGGGTLSRDDDSIDIRVSAAGLDKKSTYSAWFIIFNNPEACGGDSAPLPCGESDLGNPAVNAAVRNAGGFVTGTDGTGYFSGELEVGDSPAGMAGFGALNDSMAAEVHVLLQSHSSHSIGYVSLQMSVPGAACNPDCEDQLFLIFPPAP